MPNQFFSPEGDLENYFVTDYWLIDQYVGDQLWMFGSNGFNLLVPAYTRQLGISENVYTRSSPVQTVAGGTNWKRISGGYGHSAAIKTDGTLWTWGRGIEGQLGDGTQTSGKSSPSQTLAGGTNWKHLDAGGNITAAIKTDGTLWIWGQNNFGQLGDGTTVNKSSPVQVITGGTNWRQIACGRDTHAAAIKTDGTLWVWGDNSYGQLGVGTTISRSTPSQTISGGTNWRYVSSGENFTVAIKTDGTLWGWGENTNGQLGDGTTTNRSSPIQTISLGTDWKQVSCGAFHTAAIKIDGTLWTWGRNLNGQLGIGVTTNRSSPVQIITGGTNWKQVTCGNYHTMAIKTDGTLWGWGRNAGNPNSLTANGGQLGDGNTGITARSSPIQTISLGNNWKQVGCGDYHTGAIAHFDG